MSAITSHRDQQEKSEFSFHLLPFNFPIRHFTTFHLKDDLNERRKKNKTKYNPVMLPRNNNRAFFVS